MTKNKNLHFIIITRHARGVAHLYSEAILGNHTYIYIYIEREREGESS